MSISEPTTDPLIRTLSPEYILLGFLALQPAHGYELYQRLTKDLGQIWRLSQSQVYTILNRLEKQGLIEGVVESQHKLPDRRNLHLTAAGRRRFEAWLHTPTRGGLHAIRLHFISRLYFAHLLAEEILPQLIQAQISETEQALARLQGILATVPPEQTFNRMGVELRIRHLTVLLIWLNQCLVTFASPS
jgi:PadR family transcriptional regulator AphA